MKWLEEIIETYDKLGGIAHYSQVYQHIKKNTSRKLTENWEATVRNTVESHSLDSGNFKGKDIFYSVDGLGKGIWGLKSKIINTPKAEDLGEVEEKTDLPGRIKTEIYRVLRDTILTKKIKILYQNECQICNQKIKLPKNDYSEAHHIKPLGKHKGPDSANNIIILCPNHHVEFDYGIIAINPNTLEVRHKDDKNIFINKKIKMHPSHILNKEYLEYHLNNIFNA